MGRDWGPLPGIAMKRALNDPFSGLDAVLAAEKNRFNPPPGYWSADELAEKLGVNHGRACAKIREWRRKDLLLAWRGTTHSGGSCHRYAFKSPQKG